MYARAFITLALISLSACAPKPKLVDEGPKLDYTQELPPNTVALRKISPSEYPNFAVDSDNGPAIVKAIDNSLKYLTAPSSKQFYPYLDISHERAVATLQAMRETLSSPMLSTGGNGFINQTIREKFEVYQSIGAPSPGGRGYTGQVLFTGYFTPIYPASLTRGGAFQYPLYKKPDDLVRNELTGDVTGRKLPDGSIQPGYYTRQEIEQKDLLKGQELVWLTSRFDAYVISIQGSAQLRLPDGKLLEVGYAAHNGQDYTSPGEAMVRDGVLKKNQLSLRALTAYFKANPQAMDKYLWLNKRFVFFTERPGGPFGSLNVPVTPFATIATDKAIYPRAMPAFLMTKVPAGDGVNTREYRSILLDQDTGGAIRAAGRTDIYMGIGDAAGRLAGQQLYDGKLYYFAVKPELVQQYAAPITPRVPAP